jgi:hypothetical protein
VDWSGLWKVQSGAFAGWRKGEQLFNSHGCHVGHFEGHMAYNSNGEYIGEIFRDDWVGRKQGAKHRATADVVCSLESLVAAPLDARAGLDADGWEAPDF